MRIHLLYNGKSFRAPSQRLHLEDHPFQIFRQILYVAQNNHSLGIPGVLANIRQHSYKQSAQARKLLFFHAVLLPDVEQLFYNHHENKAGYKTNSNKLMRLQYFVIWILD